MSSCRRTLDRFLRLIVVTPDMHRVHHSVSRERDQQQLRIQSALVGPDCSEPTAPGRRRASRG